MRQTTFWLPFAAGVLTLLVMGWLYVRWDTQYLRGKRLPVSLWLRLLTPLLLSTALMAGVVFAGIPPLFRAVCALPNASNRSATDLCVLLSVIAGFGLYLFSDGVVRRWLRLNVVRSGDGRFDDGIPSEITAYLNAQGEP